MPQIAKGGKYVFGWSEIGLGGRVQIPPEAQVEYRLLPGEKVILTSGSRTTGGFAVSTKNLLQQSALAAFLVSRPDLAETRMAEGQTVIYKGRPYCWVRLNPLGQLELLPAVLAAYGLKVGDDLLSVRGSGIALGMGVKGPLISYARQHPDIPRFAG